MDHPQFPELTPRELVPPKDDIHCVLSTGLIYLLPKFHGFAGECPHRHLEEFHSMCSSMKPPHVPLDHIFLRAFPHSLQGAAKDWLYCLPPGLITRWEDLEENFLSKFSPVQDGYNNGPGWNDPNLGWYNAPQHQYQESPFESPFMPPQVQQCQSQQYNAPAQITPQPSTSEPTLKELLEQMTIQRIQFEQIQQETQAAMKNMTDQIRQIATLAPEDNAEDFEDQARISSSTEPGRPPSSSHTLEIFKEEEVSIPQFDYSVDCDDDRYADNHIVAEHVFNSPSEHESVIDIAYNFEIDSCFEEVSTVQYDNLGVIPLHEFSLEPHCTNPIAGGTNEFDQHTPTVENKGAYTDSSKINMHLLNPLSNNICCLDPAVEDISLLDQIWRMKQIVLNNFMLDPEAKNISLIVQIWQLPP
ncbi:hypothetical protein VIGAN_04089100 [Vigna angularis var. angularis]|uniref:Retrotransposon gag domain-containing protein n=1 Tax=Vigna angularis var. angularis TaxID=157739 RepID=A0A0S3RSX1_PHAAN|nr:hypothetical protein VIGAN_04089100 [Vigna angularis var. angularis]